MDARHPPGLGGGGSADCGKGKATRQRYTHAECPLGKLWNPSANIELSVCRHAVQLTSPFQSGNAPSSPPTTSGPPAITSAGSRSHLDNRSGRGFPMISLSPSTNRNVTASARNRPSHAACHSHSFERHAVYFLFLLICEVAFVVVMVVVVIVAGVAMRAMTAVSTAGMKTDTKARVAVETFSWRTWGKEMDGSTGEKGRRLAGLRQKMAPTMAMPLFV